MSTVSRSSLAVSLVAAAVFGFSGGAAVGAFSDSAGSGTPSAAGSTGGTVAAPSASVIPAATPEASKPPAVAAKVSLQAVPTPDQRIALSGNYEPSAGGIVLTVQRQAADGSWANFGTTAVTSTTRADGSFTTTIRSTRKGPANFRVVTAAADGTEVASNPVPVTIP